MTQHTPLPWIIRSETGLNAQVTGESDKDGNYESIGYLNKGNAEFIVRACNSYYEMLLALIEVYRDVELDEGNLHGAFGGSTELSIMVERAINNAEGNSK